MNLVLMILAIACIVWWAWKVADYYSQNPPKESACTQDCNQGRNCTCGWPGTEEKCTAECLEHWPFPKEKP